jgi:hypothetical protein
MADTPGGILCGETFMLSNPEQNSGPGSQEHNKPKPSEVEAERAVPPGEGQPFHLSPSERRAAERLSKPPPLHPIFERLSQALAKQQEAERSGKPRPQPLDPAELDRREQTRVSERERKRRWR